MLKIRVRLPTEDLFAFNWLYIQMYGPMRFLVNIDEKWLLQHKINYYN